MEFVLLGWPDEGPTLRLDYRDFAYAGKFVMSNTGKAVVRDPDPPGTPDEFDDGVVAAVAFNADRTDDRTLWIRYVTVREDHRGDGWGPRLAAFVTDRAAGRDYDRLRIAVNNPFAYQALYRAGFAYTGDRTGLAELVLERLADRPAARGTATYRAGLDVYRDRELGDPEATFLESKTDASPPSLVAWETGETRQREGDSNRSPSNGR